MSGSPTQLRLKTNQMEPIVLAWLPTKEQEIEKDAEVRLIDAFVDWLPLEDMHFQTKGQSKEGRPAYQVGDLLKLYIYGYLNRIRSSRQLEKHWFSPL